MVSKNKYFLKKKPDNLSLIAYFNEVKCEIKEELLGINVTFVL